MNRNGIVAAGNLICDRIRIIDTWPREGMLSTVLHEEKSTGGSSCNVLVDLARLKAGIPLYACGILGDDTDGRFVKNTLEGLGIDTSHVSVRKGLSSSYTDVMTVKESGRRTFFHFRGANGTLDVEHLQNLDVPARIVHLGYLLLLDRLDSDDPEYGVRAARALDALQSTGYETSVDVVSENSARFQQIVTPCLPYIDYLILNEIEAGNSTGCRIRTADDTLDGDQVLTAAGRLLAGGVGKAVIIHFPEGAYGITADGKEVFEPSYLVKEKDIAGTAGAGDAFCAGVLYGLHSELPLRDSVRLGNAAARFVLNDTTCSGGAGTLEEIKGFISHDPELRRDSCCESLMKRFGRR
jgi:sugar/nucleoside kinase (ribokinase family)